MKNNIILSISVFLFCLSISLFAKENIQLGVRPYYLINTMSESKIKNELLACKNKTNKRSTFSIGHRGAPLQFPEHTRESYEAAARMGAGIIECDVTFTKDKVLVCRHSQSDLHATTNILLTALKNKCSEAFTPAEFSKSGELIKDANALCKTTDITLAEFKTLKGKMDSTNKKAKTVEEYVNSTASFRTDLYTQEGTLLTHKESIVLFKKLGVKMTPELKSVSVKMPYEGTYTQEDYAQQMINEYKELNVSPKDVFAQSFNINDIKYWLKNEKAFGKQAVYLDDIVYKDKDKDGEKKQIANIKYYKSLGINYIAPPMWALVNLDEKNNIVPSLYAKEANKNKLKIITWTLERSGLLKDKGGGWYYQSIKDKIKTDGNMYELLDVLAQKVKIKGIFSDWPATVTYYANCKNIE
ncbi:MAG: glycerophosphodiester phosphodiesterase [Campylobacteraceae bacterium]|nr:glycerophosphodiester phosphodiesterase [Campylobacteraceae bacterium]